MLVGTGGTEAGNVKQSWEMCVEVYLPPPEVKNTAVLDFPFSPISFNAFTVTP